MGLIVEVLTVEQIVRNIFVIISTPLYLLFMAVLIRFRKRIPFNSAFFRLNLVTGVIDLWSIAHNYIIYEYVAIGIAVDLLRPLLQWASSLVVKVDCISLETTFSLRTVWPSPLCSPIFNGRWPLCWRSIVTLHCTSLWNTRRYESKHKRMRENCLQLWQRDRQNLYIALCFLVTLFSLVCNTLAEPYFYEQVYANNASAMLFAVRKPLMLVSKGGNVIRYGKWRRAFSSSPTQYKAWSASSATYRAWFSTRWSFISTFAYKRRLRALVHKTASCRLFASAR